MLQILLLILKIIGIVLLSILALLILFIAFLLFVPVRYRVLFKKKQDIAADAKVSWLLHIVSARVRYIDGKNKIALYVFGIKIYDSTKPKKVKNKKSGRKKGKSKKNRQKKADEKNRQISDEPELLIQGDKENPATDTDGEVLIKSADDIKIEYKTEAFNDRTAGNNLIQSITVNEQQDIKPESVKKKKINIFKKISEVFTKIINKIKSIINTIKSLFTEFRHKKNVIKDFIGSQANKAGLKAGWAYVKRLIKAVKPKKVIGRVDFGTGDPCSTGQLLGLISIFYGAVPQKVKLTPDFENKIFEADLKIKGRIIMITLVRIVIKVLRDKDIKQLRNSFDSFKEDIKKPEAA